MSVRQGVNTIAGAVGKYPLNERNITNCITHIPQDIKLELNNGTLTLKAGSKVYVPNGAGVFNEITIASDLTRTSFGSETTSLLYYVPSTNVLTYERVSTSSSGASHTPAAYSVWYDTANNVINRYQGDASTPSSTVSLPIAIIKTSSSAISSINQVFNGFGYIGLTVFALPGVKGLIPDGRNADGSLKNIETAISIPKIMTMPSYMAGRNNAPLCLISNASLGGMDINNNYYGSVEYLKDLSNVYKYYSCWYCAEDNLVHYFDGSAVESISQRAFIGSFDVDTNNKITAINPKFAFHAVDYSDTNFIANQAMPSSSITTLTLGASGASYTAPSDGYVFVYFGNQANASAYIKTSALQTGAFNINFPSFFLPVSKGTNFTVDYSGGTPFLYFVYSNGAI